MAFDRAFERATRKTLNFKNYEDVVLALSAAYEWMYYKSDDAAMDKKILDRREELIDIYDSATGKKRTSLEDFYRILPLLEAQKRVQEEEKASLSNLDLTYEVESLNDTIKSLKVRVYKLERWRAMLREEENDKS